MEEIIGDSTSETTTVLQQRAVETMPPLSAAHDRAAARDLASIARLPDHQIARFCGGRPLKWLLIFLGSGVGGLARYTLSGWVQRHGNGTFPLGTLAVNLVGCLLIGFLTAAFAGRWLVREEYRAAMLIGVLGGFTTFSTFGWETFAFFNEGQSGRALLNIGTNVLLGLAAVWAGYRVAEAWLGP